MKINNTEYSFGGFRIYENGEILYSTDRSYLELHEIKDGKVNSFWMNRVSNINLQGEIKRANKLNLNRTDNFTMTENIKYGYPARQQVLYIHASEISVESMGDLISMQTADQTSYIQGYKLNFKSGYSYQGYDLIEVPDGYKYTDKAEMESSYTNHQGKHFIKKFKMIEKNEVIFTGDYITQTVYSDFMLNVQGMQNELEDIGVKISSYDLEKMMRKYDIVKK